MLLSLTTNSLKERWVEARHAKNKRNVASAHNVGPAFVGFLSVLPKLRDLVRKGDLVQLASLCEQTTTMSRLFTNMRLNHHPQTQRIHNDCATHVLNPLPGDYRFAREFNRRGYKDLVKVLFHTDRQSSHGIIPELDEPDQAYPEPDDAIDDDDDGHPPGPPPLPPPSLPPPGGDGADNDDCDDDDGRDGGSGNGDNGDDDGADAPPNAGKDVRPH